MTAEPRTESGGVPRRLCSVVSRQNGDDPIGTATPYDTYLAIEIPPPWKEDIAASVNYPPGLWDALVRAFEAGAITRTTGVLPDPDYSVESHTRVLALRRPEEPFARFEKVEYLLPGGDLVGFVEALAAGEGERFDSFLRPAESIRDLLVCTHGANDACCGKFGYPVYDRLRWLARDSENLRVWRTSHIGGHRFAATLMDLPDGRCWGHLDAETAERVLYRDVPAADLAERYRGWAGLRTDLEQVAERAVLAREGWDWSGYLKSSRLTSREAGGAEVRLDYSSPDGAISGAYEATVEPAPSVMTLPKSGPGPLQEVVKYRVARLERVE